jgi:hypothetical protein
MKWSQLKKQIRSLICDELRDRVDFHKAVYRKSYDSLYDRAWITIDGEQVIEFSHGEWSKVWREAKSRVEVTEPNAHWERQSKLVAAAIKDSGVGSTDFLSHSLHSYLEMDISDCLKSANPLIRAFALIDRRTGSRSLARFKPSPDDLPLVKEFYELRVSKSRKNR